MDELQAIQFRECVSALKSIKKMCLTKHEKTIDDLIYYYSGELLKYNNSTRTILDPTKAEIGKVNSSLKKITVGFFVNSLRENYPDKDVNFKCECCDYELEIFTDNCLSKQDEIFAHNQRQYEKWRELVTIVQNACDLTILSEEVINAKITLSRRTNWGNMNDVETALNEILKTEMLKQFIEQNPNITEQLNLKMKEHETNEQ